VLTEVKFSASIARLAVAGPVDVGHGVGCEGDLVVAEVVGSPTGYRRVENSHGRLVELYPEDRFVGVLGNRESSQNVVGHIPAGGLDTRQGEGLAVLSGTGIIGVATDTRGGNETRVRLHGLVRGENGHRRNLVDLAYAWDRPVSTSAPMVIVAATASGAGKTRLTADLVSRIHGRGLRCTAGKLAGTAGLEDILQYFDAGACHVLDSHHAGLPSTYTSPRRYLASLRSMVHELNAAAPAVVVGELGGDLVGCNVETFFRCEEVMEHVVQIALIVVDTVAAIGALTLLRAWAPNAAVSLVVPYCRNPAAAALRAEAHLGEPVLDVCSAGDLDTFVSRIVDARIG
jgi:hypothetical protein